MSLCLTSLPLEPRRAWHGGARRKYLQNLSANDCGVVLVSGVKLAVSYCNDIEVRRLLGGLGRAGPSTSLCAWKKTVPALSLQSCFGALGTADTSSESRASAMAPEC